MLSKYPQLRDALEKGTAYKPQYAYSSMQWHEIGHWIAANVVKQAQRYDELPKRVYSSWMKAFYEAFIKHTDDTPTAAQRTKASMSSETRDAYRYTTKNSYLWERCRQQTPPAMITLIQLEYKHYLHTNNTA